MEKHHQESIDIFLQRYKNDTSVRAILLAGSLAHGFSDAESDIDIMLVVDGAEFKERKAQNALAFALWDICNYKDGYIDCKVVDLAFMKMVAEKGSDAARYAFKDCKILYSRIDNLDQILQEISVYPKDKVVERRKRFAAQLSAWQWFYSEGMKKNNSYLMLLAIQKIVLFSGRIILNENLILYPYHKWLLKVIEKANNKPNDFLVKIEELLAAHSREKVSGICTDIFSYINFNEKSVDWGNYFLNDSEQNWIRHEPPVDDL